MPYLEICGIVDISSILNSKIQMKRKQIWLQLNKNRYEKNTPK